MVRVQQGELGKPVNLTFTGFIYFRGHRPKWNVDLPRGSKAIGLEDPDGVALQVRNMVRDRDAIKPDLTFEATKRQFSKKNPPLGEVQMKTLGIMTHDGVYTNLGLLLSDQCVHTIKVTAFEGTTQSQFIEKCSEILFRNSSAAGENTWYFFQIIFRPDSSFGSRGRKQRRLSSEVSVR